MDSKNKVEEEIEQEFSAAQEAARAGNEGKVRVCARRAAARSVMFFLQHYREQSLRKDTMSQLLQVKDDERLPQEVRLAAQRLTARITPQFRYPFREDPVADAKTIIKYFFRLMDEQSH